MKLDRTLNTKRGSIWGIVSKVISVILPFIVRTVFIKTLGMDYLGLSGLFVSILNILNMSELGVGTAIVFSMYKPIAEDNTEQICALMGLYKKIYRYIGLFVLIVGLFLLPFLPNLIHGEVPADINLYILYLIYLSNTVITYWLFAYKNCILQAFQRADLISIIELIINTIISILQIVVLILYPNFYVYVIVNPALLIISNCVTAYVANRKYPQYQCRGTVSSNDKRDISKRVAGLMMDKMAFVTRKTIGNIIVSSFLGLTMVAIYNNYYYITTAVSAFFLVLTNAMGAGIGNSIASESVDKNLNDYRTLNFLYLSFAYFVYVELLCSLQSFMVIWVGESLCLSEISMILFCILFLVEKNANILGRFYDSAGLWWFGKWKGGVQMIITILLTYYAGKFFGVEGILVASILCILLMSFLFTLYYLNRYYFKKSFWDLAFDNYKHLFPLVGLGLVTYYIVENALVIMTTNIWVGLLVRIILGAIVGLLLYVLFYFKSNTFRRSLSWFKIHIKV